MKFYLSFYSLIALVLLNQITVAQCASSNSVSTNNLVFDMPFTNGGGTDVSGNNLNATLVLTTPINDRNNISNQAVSLSGSFNSGGTVAHSPLLDFTNQITISTWIKVNNYTGVKRIIDKINGSVTGNFLLDMNGATLRFFVASGSIQQPITGISPNTWFHVAATYDGTVTSLYINGVLKNSSVGIFGNLATNTSPMKIGLDQSGANPFAGGIDDIKIYGRSLSATEVADLYQTPVFDVQPPASVNMCTNHTTITGHAISTGTFATYKWKKGATYLTNNSTYSGVTTNTLTIINGGAPEAGTYQLEAFSPNCISVLSQTVAVSTASLTTLNTAGLILNYPFNNQMGNDISGNSLDATIIGTYGTTADQNNSSNSALDFYSAKTLTPHNNLMNVTNQLSLSCWFKPSIISANSSIAHRLVDKYSGSNGIIVDINANHIRFFCGSMLATSTATVDINNWYHVAVTYDGANMKIYLNGTLDQTIPYTGNVLPNTSAFTIGRDQSNTSDFYGSMNDVRFYSRAISQQEIIDIMQASDVIVSPSNNLFCLGQNAVLVANASSSEIIWKKNGVIMTDGGNIAGTLTPTLTISNLTPSDYDTYSCEVVHNCVASTPSNFSIAQRNKVAVSNANLYSYYAFNNAVGTDFSGNGKHLPFTQGVSSVPDKDNNANKALNFNGTNSYAYMNSDPEMYNNGSATTFAMWLKPGSTGGQRIIEKNGSYYVDINAGVYRFILNTGNVFNTTATPTVGVWQHIAFTYDGVNTMKFFLNGVLTNTLAAGAFSLTPNTAPFYVGCTNVFSLRYMGVIDELRFYKRALSDQEVYGLFYGPSIQQQISSSVACNTGSVTLNATSFSSEPVAYQWYLNGNILSGQTSPTLSIPSLNNTNTGAYVCAYSNLCSSIPTDTALVQLLTASDVTITPNPAVTCPGVPLTVTAISPATASSYSWTVSNGLVVSTTSAVTPTLNSGTISYTVAVASGTCTVQTAVTVSVTSCTGIEENLLSETSIYPNPVNDIVTIRLNNIKSAIKADIQGVDGRILKTLTLDLSENSISFLEFADGIYFITIYSGNDKKTYKIIKQ